MIVPLVIAAIAVFVTLCYASYLDIRDRRVPFRTWYPMCLIAVPAVTWWYFSIFAGGKIFSAIFYLGLTGILIAAFYILAAILHLYGGADAWAMIFIAASIPIFPIIPIFGSPPLGSFPFTVFVNAVLLNLLVPIGIFFRNVAMGNKAPLVYLFLGFPVEGKKIGDSFGFIMEDISEHDGCIKRRFINVGDAFHDSIKGKRRLYTRDLRINPGEYCKELDLYARAGYVWISYGVPFIVPITAGMATALVLGDMLFTAMKLFGGL